MKTKKIISALIAGILAATAAVSVSAATLSDVTPDNSTEVKANIVDPGSVSYVITIPETADFGTLTQPESTDTDHYTFYDFQVEATELNIKSNQGVSVYMKDGSADDNQFYISQKVESDPFTIAYDVYDTTVNEETVGSFEPINTTATPGTSGYHLCTFLAGSTGSTQDVTLALNQNALYGQTLSDIAGDYSGTIAFHSALIER
ncbi:hypothetical protein [Ruminococcus sp.]|uniref:hypothetical protein n=1 Tax=Ruminococcus sp. TaxID=41978 RepID=UPI0025F1151E|nr:hypothetical protein [Ruminococcus sp.]MCI2112005.1 hypothetical protein [Ruminococcus sp.]MDD6988999.1 hypothetical protein [Ruminococcus sp.]MDY6201188.1 hypothetical protein [Ruminococcus sp.]